MASAEYDDVVWRGCWRRCFDVHIWKSYDLYNSCRAWKIARWAKKKGFSQLHWIFFLELSTSMWCSSKEEVEEESVEVATCMFHFSLTLHPISCFFFKCFSIHCYLNPLPTLKPYKRQWTPTRIKIKSYMVKNTFWNPRLIIFTGRTVSSEVERSDVQQCLSESKIR